MAEFLKAIPHILRHEGGWVDDPVDPGGETNFGISTLIIKREKITAQELGIPDFSPGNLKFMKVEAAVDIYRRLFWDKYKYGKINDQTMATKIFDVAVNCGPGNAHVMAQKACNKLGCLLTEDGALGDKSFAALNSVDPADWLKVMCEKQREYYSDLITRKPRLVRFQYNWFRRAKWPL